MAAKVSERHRVKISATVDPHLLRAVDAFVNEHSGFDRSKIIDEALRLCESLELVFAIDNDLPAANAHAVLGQLREVAREILPRGNDVRCQCAAV